MIQWYAWCCSGWCEMTRTIVLMTCNDGHVLLCWRMLMEGTTSSESLPSLQMKQCSRKKIAKSRLRGGAIAIQAKGPWKRDSSSACQPTEWLPSTYRLRLQQSLEKVQRPIMTWGKIWWDVVPGQDASKLTALYEICSHSLCSVVYVHICHVYHTPNYEQTPLIQPQSWQIQLSKAPKEHTHSHVPWPFLIPQCDSYTVTWKWCYWILLMHHYLKAKPGVVKTDANQGLAIPSCCWCHT